jgi:hypothetical protein
MILNHLAQVRKIQAFDKWQIIKTASSQWVKSEDQDEILAKFQWMRLLLASFPAQISRGEKCYWSDWAFGKAQQVRWNATGSDKGNLVPLSTLGDREANSIKLIEDSEWMRGKRHCTFAYFKVLPEVISVRSKEEKNELISPSTCISQLCEMLVCCY